MAERTRSLQLKIRGDVAHVRFDRPEVKNAFDDAVAVEIVETFAEIARTPGLRAVVLGGEGDVFCAGGDLNWMKRVAAYTREENLEDAAAFQKAFAAVDECPLPVVARVQGAALGRPLFVLFH